MARSDTVEAIVLRSLRSGEADRVLHLLTREEGRVHAIAKGARRTGARWGARLEPLSRIQAVLHRGRGELAPVGSVHLVRSGQAVRDDPYRLGVALVGVELASRLFPEAPEAPERLFDGLDRFLAVAEDVVPRPTDPSLDPLALAFGLKLLALAGWLPELAACVGCGAPAPLVAQSAALGGVTCPDCRQGVAIDPAAPAAGLALLRAPLATGVELDRVLCRDLRGIVAETAAHHIGGALRTLPR